MLEIILFGGNWFIFLMSSEHKDATVVYSVNFNVLLLVF